MNSKNDGIEYGAGSNYHSFVEESSPIQTLHVISFSPKTLEFHFHFFHKHKYYVYGLWTKIYT